MSNMFERLAKYYKGLPQQDAAFDYLDTLLTEDQKKAVLKLYRQPMESESSVEPEKPKKLKINWLDFNSKVSRYFTVGEVTRFDVARIPTDPQIQANIIELALELDKIREAWGSAIIVTSWYRPPTVNRRIGGARRSQHLTGRAADIKPARGSVGQFQTWLDKGLWSDKALGYGARRGFVHVDLRKGNIRWNY